MYVCVDRRLRLSTIFFPTCATHGLWHFLLHSLPVYNYCTSDALVEVEWSAAKRLGVEHEHPFPFPYANATRPIRDEERPWQQRRTGRTATSAEEAHRSRPRDATRRGWAAPRYRIVRARGTADLVVHPPDKLMRTAVVTPGRESSMDRSAAAAAARLILIRCSVNVMARLGLGFFMASRGRQVTGE